MSKLITGLLSAAVNDKPLALSPEDPTPQEEEAIRLALSIRRAKRRIRNFRKGTQETQGPCEWLTEDEVSGFLRIDHHFLGVELQRLAVLSVQ